MNWGGYNIYGFTDYSYVLNELRLLDKDTQPTDKIRFRNILLSLQVIRVRAPPTFELIFHPDNQSAA